MAAIGTKYSESLSKTTSEEDGKKGEFQCEDDMENHASFQICGIEFSHNTLSVTFHDGTSSDNVNMPSIGGIKVGRRVLNTGGKVM